MAKISEYKKANGKKAYKVQGYLGIDPETGKQVLYRKSGFASKKSAQLAYSRVLSDIEKNGFKKHRFGTFKQVYELWLKTYKLTVKESSLVKLKQKFNKHILPAFGDEAIDKIKPIDVQQFANEMREINKGYREYISNVSRIFEFAIKQDIVNKNPVKRITIPRPKKQLVKDKVKYFTQSQLKLFLRDAQANEPSLIYTFFYLAANSGCREGELLGLQWDAIDFKAKTLSVRQTLARGDERRLYLEEPKTKNSRRIIPLDDATLAVLKQWRLMQRAEMLQVKVSTFSAKQLVFSNIDNEFIQLTHPRLWMQRICKRVGLPILSPHALRHTFATLLISNGVNFKTVSMLLGHSSVAFTLDTYAGVYSADKTAAIDLMSRALK